MSAGIKVEIGKISGPWEDIVIESAEEADIVRIIARHLSPSAKIAVHAAKPKMLPGVWKLTTDTQEGTGIIKLVAIKLKMPAEKFKGVYGAEWRGRFQLVVEKPGVGFFQIKGVAIVCDDDIAFAKENVEVLCKSSIVLEAIAIALIIRERPDGDVPFISPTVGEA